MADEKGMLYICATPIGNLGDISARCLQTLNSVDIIAAEDTRRTVQLLNHFEIKKPLTSYYEHNKHEKGEYIIKLLSEGKNIALVSDAGTPVISDPGEELVRLCIENGITVTSIPGAVAGINALILSGLPANRYAFEGFLPVNKRSRRRQLESVRNDTHTLIFYEAPHKLCSTLEDMKSVFGGERKIALAREMTKLHEEIIRTTIDGAVEMYAEKAPRGEYVLIVEGAVKAVTDEAPFWSDMTVSEHIGKYISDGIPQKEALKMAANDRGLPKREVYSIYHNANGKGDDDRKNGFEAT